MATVTELNSLTLTELGTLAKEIALPGWSKMRKEELARVLANKSRSKSVGDAINKFVRSAGKQKDASPSKKAAGTSAVSKSKAAQKPADGTAKPAPAAAGVSAGVAAALPSFLGKQGLRRDISTQLADGKPDRLVLMVRDPFWLHAFWEISPKTMDRARVALGHHWYTSIPVLRLIKLVSDGSGPQKRLLVKDIPIHGGVNNWYVDVANPPSVFLVELGYLTVGKKFYTTLSSNIVATPQQQVIDELDHLDGHWKGIVDDLDRVYKLSGGEESSQELKDVLEEQLGRPMSAKMLSRYRIAKQGTQDKTVRNFHFTADVDVIIHGRTDPNVQVSVRDEPVQVNKDGTFSVRFALPEKRHLFSVEAEGGDGAEMQRIILTLERNTRILETVIQEPNEDD